MPRAQESIDPAAVEAKRKKLREMRESVTLLDQQSVSKEALRTDIEAAGSLYDRYRVGELRHLDRNRLSWLPPGESWGDDLFLYWPKRSRPFSFRSAAGGVVEPRTMVTDIGTIPGFAGLFRRGLSKWGYAAAYLIHDWEFEQHHCGQTSKSFEEVRDTMMEVLKTLMERRLAPKNLFDFWLIYQGIDSRIARGLWNRHPPRCTIPPDTPE